MNTAPQSAPAVHISSQALRTQNDLKGLSLLHRFGWLRAPELGKLFWPTQEHASVRVNRLVRSWAERKLVLVRRLPEGAGQAVVLSEAGARLLRDYADMDAKSGKDWGETRGAMWVPALTWKHDLIATGVLAELSKRGYEIRTERELREAEPKRSAVPDGLAWRQGDTIWVEVEHARKSGPKMRFLALKLSQISDPDGAMIADRRVTTAMVVYRAEGTEDERGFRVDHRSRVSSAISEYAKHPVQLTWAAYEPAGAGLGAIELRKDVIYPNPALALVKRLEWEHTPDTAECSESWEAAYNGWLACIWIEPEHSNQMYWQIEDVDSAIPVDSISEGKLACAARLLKLGPRRCEMP